MKGGIALERHDEGSGRAKERRQVMKIGGISKDDILEKLGLQTKTSTGEWLLGALGFFGIGLVVGAATALLLAPKSGRELRGDISAKARSLRGQSAEQPH